MNTEIAIIPQENVLEVFTAPKGLDPFLDRIAEEARSLVPDVTTKKGRDAIASVAFKVAKSKTALDNVGKALVDRLKEQPKLVDAERKRMRDFLDSLKDEVRKPLTEWEEAEEKRKQILADRVQWFASLPTDAHMLDAQELQHRIGECERMATDGMDEYETEALRAKDNALTALRAALAAREKSDAEQAELAKLRAEAAERQAKEQAEQAERDRIAAEEKAKADQAERERVAAENARIEAEQEAARKQAEADAKAKADIEAAEQRERDAKLAQERAERERQEAIARAERAEKEAKEKAERERREADEREAAETARREANKRHVAKINNEALDALVAGGIDATTAKTVITLIAQRKVPNVKINY